MAFVCAENDDMESLGLPELVGENQLSQQLGSLKITTFGEVQCRCMEIVGQCSRIDGQVFSAG